ncbi:MULTISPECIES: bifunctional 4-hydroxy-2-oxoglutarate aldolase/2-dehydro-3-deoxy-phosphogluconate aldolase [unclassified Lysobacter]|uniref:bifunctional 4-hydroxy-2-oxoglutarate aldolase/2-dehydro-3-deoxy-phosphogluconate aldolase n=1 Tax=unclassified Lysobacter TaxID=2635362 RepID=UPI001C23C36A|nr:bifunctional 4-hydroxy-2-oxoglutarate aldolase/2-dehydro-3-deoxy-phosphogluconate aldolase [Lysobacter sp. MMG2]MBU8975988.1 bifunctional 4-hydroxy-2-oxoglutarate aldolase/2-dehydro-3-deoxy-phosphogluconate aldolase [Lysobacter sp. MMG2]
MSAVDAQAVLQGHRIVPVYTPASVDEALAVARALKAGGIGAIEVTLRTQVAMDAVAAIARELPGMRVGVGTVLDVEQMRGAKDVGATFIVSPGSSRELLQAAVEMRIAYLPGVATGSEVMAALAAGHRLLKVFPAEPINAFELINAWRGPFAQARFCPTGGIDAARAREYLRLPNVACLGGSWLTPSDALRAGDWARIEGLAREAVALVAD